MNRIEGKYEIYARPISNTERETVIRNRFTGTEIPMDEPIMIFRARDELALDLLKEYHRMARNEGCDRPFLLAVEERIRAFEAYAQAHPRKVPD